ncbi:MAG: ATP-binding cassette domain-containing protein [Candidatus Eremiobacteraeota bacterium]|nr:ATP-binding cassette domain-containing protein [Candidatus Eremiobacteraeota bacterium]
MPAVSCGRVTRVGGGRVQADLPCAAHGDAVKIGIANAPLFGTIADVCSQNVSVIPHGSIEGVVPGDVVRIEPEGLCVPLGMGALGRAFDSNGNALDNRGALSGRATKICRRVPTAAQRAEISVPLWSGVRSIDGLLTIGRGARIGIFGAPGAGKSTLLQAIARGVCADAVVIGLIGERGREAREWIERCDTRTSIVCATSDRCAAERVHAACVAFAQADVLRSRGLHVLVILDSLARFGSALREVAVASGESVGRAGFPASVFAQMAQLVEIGGASFRGSISLVATVLTDGDERDPLSEAARSILDGHIELSQRLATRGHFPAIDIARSASRTMAGVVGSGHRSAAAAVRKAIAWLEQTQDARDLGIASTDPYGLLVQSAQPAIEEFLQQGEDSIKPERALAELSALADRVRGTTWTSPPI